MFRTMLFSPGNNPKRMKKALDLPADAIIFDLEDAVAVTEKESARNIISEVLSQHQKLRKEIIVRINALDTPYAAGDLEAIVPNKPDGIMLPKSETAEAIKGVAERISQLEKQSGMEAGTIALFPLVETAVGVLNAREIAAASDRIVCLSFGAIDFTTDIGVKLTAGGEELFYARSHLVLASRAARIGAPVDTVYPNIKDDQGLRQETELAAQLGMFGKLVIHPNQIPVVNQVFTPDEKEVAWAKKVNDAYEEAEKQGIGAIQVDGKFIDVPVANRAKKVLALAAEIEKKTD